MKSITLELDEVSILSTYNEVRILRLIEPQPHPDLVPRSLGNDDFPSSSDCPYGNIGDILWVKEAWSNNFGPIGESIIYAHEATGKDELGPWESPELMSEEDSRFKVEITCIGVAQVKRMGHLGNWFWNIDLSLYSIKKDT